MAIGEDLTELTAGRMSLMRFVLRQVRRQPVTEVEKQAIRNWQLEASPLPWQLLRLAMDSAIQPAVLCAGIMPSTLVVLGPEQLSRIGAALGLSAQQQQAMIEAVSRGCFDNHRQEAEMTLLRDRLRERRQAELGPLDGIKTSVGVIPNGSTDLDSKEEVPSQPAGVRVVVWGKPDVQPSQASPLEQLNAGLIKTPRFYYLQRMQRRLSLLELAERSGIGGHDLRRLEGDREYMLPFPQLQCLAAALEVPVNDLFDAHKRQCLVA